MDRAYLYSVCFTAILLALFAGAATAYEGFRILAPDITGTLSHRLERQQGLAGLLSTGYLALVSLMIFRWAWVSVNPNNDPDIDDTLTGNSSHGSSEPATNTSQEGALDTAPTASTSSTKSGEPPPPA